MFKKYSIELETTFDSKAPLFLDFNNKLRYNNNDMLIDNSNKFHLNIIGYYFLIASTNIDYNKPIIPQSLIDLYVKTYNNGEILNIIYLDIDDNRNLKINDKNEIIFTIDPKLNEKTI